MIDQDRVISMGGIFLFAMMTFGIPSVTAQTPSLTLATVETMPGAIEVPVPLRLTHKAPVHALAIGITYDQLNTTLVEFSLGGGVLDGIQLEFSHLDIDPTSGEIAFFVVLDSSAPYDPVIPPGADQLVAELIFDMGSGLLPGQEFLVEFSEGVGTPPATNHVFASFSSACYGTVDGAAMVPDLISGKLVISNENSFIAEDMTVAAGSQGTVGQLLGTNTQALDGFAVVVFDNQLLHTLRVLAGETEVSSLDVLDANDDGSVNISDAIFTMKYLFQEGPPIPPPFPNPGAKTSGQHSGTASY